jgi:hypothetical protein
MCSVLADFGGRVFNCKILGFHGGDYEEWCLGISSQRVSVASYS